MKPQTKPAVKQSSPAVRGKELILEGIATSPEQIDVIRSQIFPGATNEELRLFFYECRRRGVHPMDRMIFPVTRNVKVGENKFERRVSFQTGIDYLRSASDETGLYAGMDDIEYGEEMALKDHPEIMVPASAKATVYRRDKETGENVKVSATIQWREFYPGEKLGFMWRNMPYHMLGKCAEAQARRKAFPAKLGGLYLKEERIIEGEAMEIPPSKESTVREAESGATSTPPVPYTVDNPRMELKRLLSEVCSGDFMTMEATLKTITYKDGKWLTIKDVDNLSVEEATKLLEDLKQRTKR